MMQTRIRLFSLLVLLALARNGWAQTVPVWKLNDLKAAINDAKTPTVINFWATFCKPCIAELPHFQEVAKSYRKQGVNLIMVSVDLKEAYPAKIAAAARLLKLVSPVVFLNESNADLFCPAVDSSWSGSIPATLFINNAMGYRRFFESELKREKFEAEVRKMMGVKPGN